MTTMRNVLMNDCTGSYIADDSTTDVNSSTNDSITDANASTDNCTADASGSTGTQTDVTMNEKGATM